MSSKSLLKTKFSPEKKINSFYTQKHIQVSKDGKHIICHCLESVNIVELSSGNVIHKIESEEEEISSLSLSPDNASLAIGYSSSNVRHYSIAESTMDPALIKTFKSYHQGPVLTMAWDSSSVLLATGSADGTLRVWDLNLKYCTHSLKNLFGVMGIIVFDKNLKERPWIFAAANEKIFVWLLQSGDSKLLSQLKGHDSSVTGMQVSHCGNKLISCGLDKVIILWDLEKFENLKIIPVFESLTGIILKPPGMDFIGTESVKDKDNVIFTIGNKGVPRIWNVDKGKELWKADEPLMPAPNDEVLLFNNLYLSESLNSFILTSYDNIILFMHCDTTKIWKQLIGQNEEILDAIFLGEDCSHTAVITNSSMIRLYEKSTNNCELITGHSAIVISLANHPIDKYVFGSSSHDNTTRIWKLSETDFLVRCIAVASGHTHSVGSLVFGKDFLVTGSNDTCIKLWPLKISSILEENSLVTLTSTRTVKAHDKDINSLALSKNMRLIASGSADRTIKVWNSSSLEHEVTLQGHRKGIWNVAFSPVDALLASASADGTIKLWDLKSYNNVATFEGHEVAVMRVSWVSEGQQLISGGADGLIKLWTVKHNTCANTFDEHDGHLWALSLNSDGDLMVTGAKDSTLIWWRDVTEEEKVKEQEEASRLIEEEQALQNLLHQRKWSKAFRLSLKLKKPARSLSIMKTLLDEDPSTFPSILRKLRKDEIGTLLEYSVQWNTKTKNLREAQSVLNFLLKEYLPEELEALPGWQSALEGLLPYTEKHLKRISALNQSVCIVEYLTACMNLEPTISLGGDKEDEETRLLSIIAKTPVVHTKEIKDEEEEEEYEDGKEISSYDEDSEGDSEDLNEMEPDGTPLESVEDIRSNFVLESIETDSEPDSDSDDEGIESGET